MATDVRSSLKDKINKLVEAIKKDQAEDNETEWNM